MKKTKILIAGIGGVGGYFGGMLAKEFCASDEVEIYFLARGENLREINLHGLKVITKNSETTVHPKLATDNANELSEMDYIIIATKSYDLENTLMQLMPCINDNTLILPLLNGVDSTDRIKHIMPNAKVASGCVYIVARLKEPGAIENSGNIQTLYFGIEEEENKSLSLLHQLFIQAKIEATLSKSISSIVWEKFVFISPTAAATSYYNHCIGELLNNSDQLLMLQDLIAVVIQLARKKNITLPEGLLEKTIAKLRALPFETTSSMHSDYQLKKANTELNSLVGYVIRESKKLQLQTPSFDKIYAHLNQ